LIQVDQAASDERGTEATSGHTLHVLLKLSACQSQNPLDRAVFYFLICLLSFIAASIISPIEILFGPQGFAPDGR